MWLALNIEKGIPRNEISQSYTHIAFSIEKAEFNKMYEKLVRLNVNILPGRHERDKKSIYFTDPDAIQVLYKTGWIIINRKRNIWSFSIKGFPWSSKGCLNLKAKVYFEALLLDFNLKSFLKIFSI